MVVSCRVVSCFRFYPCVSGLPVIGYSGIEWRSVPFTVSSYFLEFSFLLSPPEGFLLWFSVLGAAGAEASALDLLAEPPALG